jgi:hypothetical protein
MPTTAGANEDVTKKMEKVFFWGGGCYWSVPVAGQRQFHRLQLQQHFTQHNEVGPEPFVEMNRFGPLRLCAISHNVENSLTTAIILKPSEAQTLPYPVQNRVKSLRID